MVKGYQRRPCRRCGGDKLAHGPTSSTLYCLPCAGEQTRDYWRKHFVWWCRECDAPWSCSTCSENKNEWVSTAARRGAETRKRNNPGIAKPGSAELFWQKLAHRAVGHAVKRGVLPDLRGGEYACADCGKPARIYEHRDYSRQLDVVPVCGRCNKLRGTAAWPGEGRFVFPKTTNSEVS